MRIIMVLIACGLLASTGAQAGGYMYCDFKKYPETGCGNDKVNGLKCCSGNGVTACMTSCSTGRPNSDPGAAAYYSDKAREAQQSTVQQPTMEQQIQASVKALTPQQVSALTQQQLQNIPLSFLSPEQVQVLTKPQLQGMSLPQLQQIAYSLTMEQLGWLTPQQAKGLQQTMKPR